MRWKPSFHGQSLSFRQARAIALAVLAVGCIAFVLQGALLTLTARKALFERECQLLNLSEAAAAEVLLRRDAVMAQVVLRDILKTGGVARAELFDAAGVSFAVAQAAMPDPDPVLDWLSRTLLGGDRVEHPLNLGEPSAAVRIGTLQIAFSPDRDFAFYREILITNLFATLAAALVVGLLVARLFDRFLTRPILAISQQVARVDAEDPHGHLLSVPAGHRESELGLAIRRINAMLIHFGNAQQALRRMTTRDISTNLPNRTLTIEHIAGVGRRTEPDRPAAVIAVLMDRLDEFRDVLGHEEVDEIAMTMAARLLQHVDGEFVGRIGADCFVVVLESLDDAATAAEFSKRLVETLMRADGHQAAAVRSSVCAGIALLPNDGTDAADLLRKAVAAAGGARKLPNVRWNYFKDDLSAQAHRRLQLEAQIHQALEHREFELYFQPQFSAFGAVCGAEALVRWRHEGQMVLPGAFIPVAEDTGLVVPLGDFVLDEACRALAQLWAVGLEIRVAVNVSPKQLADVGFVGRVAAVLARHRVPAQALELEITEYTLAVERGALVERIRELRGMGIRIALDDFGTGYSSLSYLRRFPVDVLKIDRVFVTDIPDDVAVPSTILTLADKLGMSCVAEGVETMPQRDWLIANGCETLQGYLFARPMAFTEFFTRYAIVGGAVDLRFHRESHVVDR